ncbi:MAG: GNAT family N-acetyltransferase [Bacteroidetes bacterium]|jgi:GNAT superfamily N-acetyltransferase|nr:GNAT family N-acetyltransferase [Bacteroidota bacterium]
MTGGSASPANVGRMIALAEEVFGMRSDTDQISVDQEVVARLEAIHPATMGEMADENGPIAWMLAIPTSREVMEQFLSKRISERQILERTSSGVEATAIYLCSALVLPEHRGKGYAKRLALDAIRAIRKEHPIETLYVWSFSDEGLALAQKVAREAGLPLRERG